MRMFPLLVGVEGKKIVLAGEGRALKGKIEKMRPFGARMEVFTDDALPACPDMIVRPGLPREEDLANAAFVLIAGAEKAEAETLYALCKEKKIPVNTEDMPEACTFFFPALITRGGLTVGLSTSGQSPAAASILRERMEKQVPERMEEILDWAQEIRGPVRARVKEASVRRTVLKEAVRRAMDADRPLTDEEMEEIIQREENKG